MSQVPHDWKERAFVESVECGIRKCVDFLNNFHESAKYRLSAVDARLSTLERKLDFLEASLEHCDPGKRNAKAAPFAGSIFDPEVRRKLISQNEQIRLQNRRKFHDLVIAPKKAERKKPIQKTQTQRQPQRQTQQQPPRQQPQAAPKAAAQPKPQPMAQPAAQKPPSVPPAVPQNAQKPPPIPSGGAGPGANEPKPQRPPSQPAAQQPPPAPGPGAAGPPPNPVAQQRPPPNPVNQPPPNPVVQHKPPPNPVVPAPPGPGAAAAVGAGPGAAAPPPPPGPGAAAAKPKQQPPPLQQQPPPPQQAQQEWPNRERGQIDILTVKEGAGAVPGGQSAVEIEYTGHLGVGGKQFIKHREVIQLGKKMNIKGLEQGVTRIKVGSQIKLWIPSRLAYGARGAGNMIPPNKDLVFNLMLHRIVKQ